MHTLVLVGYWKSDRSPEWPDPFDFVDPSWNEDERRDAADYLRRGFVARAFMGKATCRICGKGVGALELSDGVFLWPESLAHYVEDHRVRPPQRLLESMRQRIDTLERAAIDDSWWRNFGVRGPSS